MLQLGQKVIQVNLEGEQVGRQQKIAQVYKSGDVVKYILSGGDSVNRETIKAL